MFARRAAEKARKYGAGYGNFRTAAVSTTGYVAVDFRTVLLKELPVGAELYQRNDDGVVFARSTCHRVVRAAVAAAIARGARLGRERSARHGQGGAPVGAQLASVSVDVCSETASVDQSPVGGVAADD